MDDLLATAEKKALIEIVRLVQKRGLKGSVGNWKEFLQSHDRKFGASLSDPARRSNDVLIAFLKTFVEEDHLKFLANVIKSYSKRNIVQQFGKSPSDESPEQRLVRLTVEHPQYPLEYAFPSNAEDWVITKPGKKSEVMRPERILAVDCEMVLCEDGTEALVRVCVVNRRLEVKMDELVNPKKPVADYRSEITGVTAEDLEGVTYSLSDVQRAIRNLLAKGNILVGHSLSNDLNAMKVDHAWVIDTSYIFRYSDVPSDRRPSLNNLCKYLLGYELRSHGAPHNCLEDARAAMKLVLARIEQKASDSISLVQMDVPATELSKLLIHRIPVNVPEEELRKIMPGDFKIEIKQFRKPEAKSYSGFAVFKSPKEAKRAYKDCEGIKEKDSFGRPQKLVSFQLSTGKSCDVYVRKMEGAKKDLPSKKRALEVEKASDVSKKHKTDGEIKEDVLMGEPIKTPKQVKTEEMKSKKKTFEVEEALNVIKEDEWLGEPIEKPKRGKTQKTKSKKQKNKKGKR